MNQIVNLPQIKRYLERSKKYFFLFFLISLTLIFVLWYVHQEKLFYYWDSNTYFLIVQNILALLHNDGFFNLLTRTYTSLGFDYNYLLSLPLAIPLYFNTSRSTYISAIALLYVFPWAIASSYLAHSFLSKKKELLKICLLLIFSLLLPIVWQPVLFGFPDIIGVFICTVILYINRDKNLLKMPATTVTFVGFLLILVIALRRYFAFWSLSFVIILTLESLIITSKKTAIHTLKKLLIFYSSIALTLTTLGPHFFQMLTKNYSLQYLPYQQNQSLLQSSVQYFFHWNSLIHSVIVIITWIFLLRSKRYVSFLTRLTGITLLTVILFTSVQSFNNHHFYLLLPFTTFLFLSAIGRLLNFEPNRIKNILFLFFLFVFSAFSMILSFTNFRSEFTFFPHWMISAVAPIDYPPQKIENYKELQNLCTFLDNKSGHGVKKIYVLASSHLINADLLMAGCPHLSFSKVSHVDTRDEFPIGFFNAEIVVLTNPIQTHLDVQGQCIIWCLTEYFHSSLIDSYSFLGEVPVSQNVTGYVYERKEPISIEKQEKFRQLLDNHISTYINEKPD